MLEKVFLKKKTEFLDQIKDKENKNKIERLRLEESKKKDD